MSFVRLDPRDVVVSADTVTAPVWSTNQPTLTTFFTSSNQQTLSTADFYAEVTAVDTAAAGVQFSIAYADDLGSGSAPFNPGVTGVSPSSAIFGQAKNLILGEETENFVFDTITSDYFYVVTLDRAQYKEKLMPATFNVKLTKGAASVHLTDNSKELTTTTFTEAGRVYQIVSGSDGASYNGTGTTVSGSYGWFLPDVGMVLFNGKALDLTSGTGGIALATDRATNNSNANNQVELFKAIKAGASFALNSEETITSNYVFARARSDEFNYSANPSMINGSTGDIRHADLINSPRTYATTVGLYNDNNDLLAVAKLSKPLQKDFTKEALVRIKLDF
tara:strand:+ start:850 stop:1854 length:1005 start_codon:yes stop_codon:yes gene_type:complete